MQVRVLWFGALKDLLPGECERVELPDHATVEQLLTTFLGNAPGADSIAASLAIAVNRVYAAPDCELHEGDEVALLPPVSGGCASQLVNDGEFVRIQSDVIRPEPILAALKQNEDGAVAIFEGIVRDNSRGRRTLYLDYEAYEAMALERMRVLATEAKQRFGVRQVALVHRVGRLSVGETSVWIAAASAHRAQAFDACRWLIDTLKKTVPIWKKEYFEDGAVWADGEPFPPEFVRPASAAFGSLSASGR